MKIASISSVALLLTLSFAAAQPCLAADITIQNCDGSQALAAQTLQGDQTASVTFEVVVSRSGSLDSELVLSNSSTGEKEMRLISAEEVSFDEIAQGTWRACLSDESISIENVSIAASTDSASLLTAGLAGTGAAATGIVLASSGGSGGGHETMAASDASLSQGTQSPTSSQAPTLNATSASAPAAKPLIPEHPCLGAKKSPQDRCFTYERPAPVSPFF
ncbi:MAG: hypothetical protein GX589_08790 [Deltaproteobacteria bacterium]|nr:hypothetical protein [Deltaproteobacteria bacterium]